jgi:nucleotide-binding universal stress UspA family protein
MSEATLSGTVVVGVDGSDHADRAVRWAAEQADLERRALVVVSVARPSPALGAALTEAGQPLASSADVERARSLCEEAAAIAEQHRHGLAISTHAVAGEVRTVLADLSHGAHLLVLGSRGRGSLRSKLLGSVSVAVSKHAACPVVVCRPSGGDDAVHGIVVGADGTPESRPVLEFAFRQATLHEQPLTVLHSTVDLLVPAARPWLIDEADTDVGSRMLLAESVAGFGEKFPDVEVRLQVARGFASDALTAPFAPWALVVVGRHAAETLSRRLSGTVATATLEHAFRTVAVVPQPARS